MFSSESMKDYSVLLTSAGVATALNVMNALRSQKRRKVRIVAGDMDPLAAGIHLADAGYILPPIKDPGYLKHLVGIAHDEKVGALIPMFSAEIELAAKESAYLRSEGLGCIVPPHRTSVLCNDKPSFGAFLEKEGFPAPRLVDPKSEKDFPVFVKPKRGSSSKGARIVRSLEELAGLDTGSMLVQEYIRGVELTIDFLASEDSKVLAAVPRERLEVKDGKAVKARTVDEPRSLSILSDLVEALKFKGPGNLQVMIAEDGPRLIELNPRFSAGGLPLSVASGPNMPLMLLEMIYEGSVPPHLDYEKGLYMVRYLTEIFVREGGSGYERCER